MELDEVIATNVNLEEFLGIVAQVLKLNVPEVFDSYRKLTLHNLSAYCTVITAALKEVFPGVFDEMESIEFVGPDSYQLTELRQDDILSMAQKLIDKQPEVDDLVEFTQLKIRPILN